VGKAGRRGRERVGHGLRLNVVAGRRRAMANARWSQDSLKELGGTWRAQATVWKLAHTKPGGNGRPPFPSRDRVVPGAQFKISTWQLHRIYSVFNAFETELNNQE